MDFDWWRAAGGAVGDCPTGYLDSVRSDDVFGAARAKAYGFQFDDEQVNNRCRVVTAVGVS